MDMTTLLLYTVAVAAVTIIPGPTMLLALNNGATKGKRVAAFGIAGAALSDLLLIGAVGCGLGAILQASEQLFTLVKWAGAAYLFYLAYQLWRAPLGAPQAQDTMPGARNGRAAFMRSLLVALPIPRGCCSFPPFCHSSFGQRATWRCNTSFSLW